MIDRSWFRIVLACAVAAGIGFFAGCSSDDGGGGDQSGPFAGGFLGLANVEQNVTQCGECHPPWVLSLGFTGAVA